MTGQGGNKTGHHFTVFHTAHQVGQVFFRFAGVHVITGNMNEENIRVHYGCLAHTVFHIIGVADDLFCSFGDQIVHQVGHCNAGTVGRVDLVDINHFTAGHRFFYLPGRLKMGLAPAVIIGRADHEQTKGKGCVCCIRRQAEQYQCQAKPRIAGTPFPIRFMVFPLYWLSSVI